MDLRTYLDNMKFVEQIVLYFFLIIFAGLILIFFGAERTASGILILLISLFISFIKTSAFCSLGIIKTCNSGRYIIADSLLTILIILFCAYKSIYLFGFNLQYTSIFAAMWSVYLLWFSHILKST